MILSHIALGQDELLNGTRDILVNNPHVTLGLLHFVAFLPNRVMDQLAPAIFIS